MPLIRNLALVLICMAVPLAACEESGSRTATDGPHPTASPSTPFVRGNERSAQGNGWWEAPLLTEPQYTSKVMVSEQKGRGDQDLPELRSNGRDAIRLVVACSGDGVVTLLVDNVDNGSRVNCDEIRTFIDVYTEAGERKISVRSGSDTRWKVAVIRK